MANENPLLSPSPLPYGLPEYSLIRPEHYLPAFEAAFDAQRREIEAITRLRARPTFENTMVALESSGRLLGDVARTFYTVSSADATPEIQEIEETLAPLMSAHQDSIQLDADLYRRIKTLHEQRDDLGLTAEQRYLVERHFREMSHAGAGLDDAAKARLTAVNQRLSTLTTTFEKNLLRDTNELAVVFEDAAELDGLAEGELSAAAQAAADRGLEGKWVVTLTLFTGHPYLSTLTDRTSRKRILDASRARGSRAGLNDNRPVLREIVRLRAERAALLGYRSHAAYVTSDETAGSPEAVHDLLRRLAVPAARNAAREQAVLQRIIDAEPEPFPLEAHDWAFYTERVRAAEYDLDRSALRPWFEAERVLRDGVFHAATELYGITFEERADLDAYHPDVRVFEVRNGDGSTLGLFLLDLYTRDTKRGGAWMNSIVLQSRLRGTQSIVVNNLNVPKPAAGRPTLLTLDEVTTLFHEFGHALHGLFATVTYPHFAGTNVFRDFVEFPSQVNEMWIYWPEILDTYARHVDTGEALPRDVVEKLRASEAFNQGFATSEYLAAAWLDQAWHSLDAETAAGDLDVADFEAAALSDIGLDNPVVPTRYSSTYFAHVFSGGYSAGYYSYIWSEVLDADTVEWFRENGGLQRANGERFRERLLGVGGSKDPLEAYRDFRGRDAEIQPLLERRGLAA
ncbi:MULTISPECIES: M3 family metallopeptidase [unclassified Microbacterium]|uniref:M3 family metallopeptidase n=1 Tax=unclassified Microbacterium TaxID=2609290 RepID=UPI00214C0BEE|nr:MULTISPECIES: M3 family metallopeptidase [unclassified Microbacterium]MCR2809474.1 M3 family metallopeptidase [Microbacterium sp. zg.B185]WIM20608.1 M3 family metallopeptidase [Microbacterium sp. zg-B185]